MRRLVVVILFLFLLSGLSLLRAQEPRPHFTQVFSKEEFARRRARVLEAIGPQAIAVLKGNRGMPGYVEFRQGNDFFYLCGVEAPGAVLLLDGATKETTLFLPPRNPRREAVEGPLFAPDDTTRELTGIRNVLEVNAFTNVMNGLMATHEILYTPLAPQELEAMSRDLATRYNVERMDDPWEGRVSREAHFVSLLHTRFPKYGIKDLSPVLDGLRLIKSEEEVAVLRRSAELSALSLMEAMRSTQPGQYEYELDALAQFIYLRNGAQGLAYYALVASGPNAYIPHYHAGQRQLQEGDFLLMDFAPDYHYYTSDVTRMWPVNGKFSSDQRELYSFYLKCYQTIMKRIRPHVRPQTVIAEAASDMEEILRQSRFSKEKHRRGAETFVRDYRARAERLGPGRVGHWVGMATHDVGGSVDVLKPGMVFTIEPALRVPEDRIYIRLEDVLLVTETGVENLSAIAPVEIDAIEALVKETGLLEHYSRNLAHDAVRPQRGQVTQQ